MPKGLSSSFAKMVRSYDRGITRFALVGDNEGNIIVGGQTGFIYVRIDGMKNEVLSVFNPAIPLASLVVGLPVWIQSSIVNNYDWQVAGVVRDDLDSTSTTGLNDAGATVTVKNNQATLAAPGIRHLVTTKSANYTLLTTDEIIVFTATATATLPAAMGGGQTYRIICRAGTLTIDGNGSDTIKGNLTDTLYAGEDVILSDTASGIWE